MHIVVSWDIHAEGERWTELNDELKECLGGYSWVKPLTTLYIVQVGTRGARIAIKDALVKVCKENPKLINLLVSPLMQGGTYGGWLAKALWPKIRKRAEVSDD